LQIRHFHFPRVISVDDVAIADDLMSAMLPLGTRRTLV
jgi:hypothetical protein